jgi:hypothetical protein
MPGHILTTLAPRQVKRAIHISLKTTIVVDSAVFFFCFRSNRDGIQPNDIRRLPRHLSGASDTTLYVPITVIGKTGIECPGLFAPLPSAEIVKYPNFMDDLVPTFGIYSKNL